VSVSVSNFRQARRLETRIGGKPYAPADSVRTPNPIRKPNMLRAAHSPSPQPSPLRRGRSVSRLAQKRSASSSHPRGRRGSLSSGRGRGEGERSVVQPHTPANRQNCQTSSVARQLGRVPCSTDSLP
jgi:hypothetical protein